jgi:predicted ribosome quality control (RQC) complex YloA/Tae2 family protein
MAISLSSFDVYFLVKELQFLLDSKIDQVYGDEKSAILSLHRSDLGKLFLIIKDELMYFTKDKPPQNENLSFFCSQLRKKIVNWRIKSISQKDFERVIDIELYFKDEVLHLLVELFMGGNIILVQNETILIAKNKKLSVQRNVSSNEKYVISNSSANIKIMSEEDLKKILNLSDKENIVKTLAIDLFLGGLYAEMILGIANIDKNSKSKDADSKKIYSAIHFILNQKLNPNKCNNKIVPIELNYLNCPDKEKTKDEKTYYESFSDALSKTDTIIEKSKTTLQINTVFDKKIKKLNSIILSQNKQIENMQKEREKNKVKADLIVKNYSIVEKEIKNSKNDKTILDLN